MRLPLRALFSACALGLCVLAAPSSRAQVIAEILADNRDGLADEDGDHPDWVELHNPTAATADLTGWRLTDDPAQPARWIFPSTTLAPGQRLVVFASGKNRSVPGQPLHTNFSLDNAGEWIALLNPTGRVVSALAFPAQFPDVSYSSESGPTLLQPVPAGAAARWTAPTAPPPAGWREPAFDDCAWAAGTLALGHSAAPTAAVLRVDFNKRGPPVTRAGFQSFELDSVGGAVPQSGTTTRSFGVHTVTVAPNGAVVDDRLRATPVNTATFTQSELLRDFVFAVDSTGTQGLDVTLAGLAPGLLHRVRLWSFDSGSPGNRVSDWFANGELIADDYTFNGTILPANDTANTITAEVAADALGQIRLEGRRQPGNSSHAVFLNALEVTPLAFAGAFATSTGAAMLGQTPSALLRVPFTVPSLAVTSATLRARWNDGFIAWIDGVEVASRNAPSAPDWNTPAPLARDPRDPLAWEDIGVPPALLTPGPHLLAVHAFNESPDGESFLIDPTLSASAAPSEVGRFHAIPTPGAPNGPSAAGVVAGPRFGVDRGLYDAPVTVAITCDTPGAEIRYTLDGTRPGPGTGLPYTTPLVITNTTPLRAVTLKSDWISTEPEAQTYVFPARVAAQPAAPAGWPATWGVDTEVNANDGAGDGTVPADYEMDPAVVAATLPGHAVPNALRALPTLSIALNPADLLSADTGIYSHPLSTGPSWERECSIELFEADGTTRFRENAMILMHGNSSRRPYRMQKHGFRVEFKAAAGTPRLRANLFPDSPVSTFNKLVLRGCFTDGWGLVSWDPARYRPDDSVSFRDVWMKESQLALGHLSGRGLFAHLYLNGLYWGVYNLTERIGVDFLSDHLGGAPEDWDVLADFNELKAGTAAAWNAAHQLASAGLSSRAAYEAFAAQVDLENLADYMLLHFFADCEDWPHHNWVAARNRVAAGAKWRFFAWDQEIMLDNHAINRTTTNNANTPSAFFQALRGKAEFRLFFADRAHRALANGGPLSLPVAQARWQALADRLDLPIVAESARWGDTADATPYGNAASKPVFTREADWLPAVAQVRDTYLPSLFDPTNSYALLPELRAANLWPLPDPPALNPHGGRVTNGFPLVITAGVGTVFATADGRDPREAWTGNPVGIAVTNGVPWILGQPVTIRARLRDGNGNWSALTEASFIPGVPAGTNRLFISEIDYHPPDPHGAAEFIELWNPTGQTLDLTGVALTGGVSFAFADGTFLSPGARMVIARDRAAFTNRHGVAAADLVAGIYSGALDNAGERVDLMGPDGDDADAASDLLDWVSYSDTGLWPAEADGGGPSLTRIRPDLAPGEAWSWRASVPAPTPGGTDSLAFQGDALADLDGNLRPDLLDHALPEGRLELIRQGDELQLSWIRAARADDARVVVQTSPDGVAWRDALTEPLRRESMTQGMWKEVHFSREEGMRHMYRLEVRLGGP